MKHTSCLFQFVVCWFASRPIQAFRQCPFGSVHRDRISLHDDLSYMLAPRTYHKPVSPHRQAALILYNQIEDDESSETTLQQQNEENKDTDAQMTSNNKQQVAQITSIIFNLFSYTIQFLGAFFTFGLVLNLLGYGYRFDFEHGVEITRLENLRNEIQFEREIIREEREDYMKERDENGDFGGAYKENIVIGNWGKSIVGK